MFFERVFEHLIYCTYFTLHNQDGNGRFGVSSDNNRTLTFDNEGSEIYTIIEIDTRDRIGLLHDLTRTLTNNYVTIASAIIATYGEQAVDTFYVKDLFGLKLHSENKRLKLAKKLKDAVDAGTLIGTQ